ncbi:MAG: sugar ABC transporter permease [Spirochaetota bacterium]|nr:MAG: sugar ABC transporter permease [Spirochaetota bacterium]
MRVFDFSTRRIRGITGVFIGLDNYKFVISDPVFRKAVLNNINLFVLIPILVFLAIIISYLLFEQLRGWKVYRGVIFMPYILPIPVVGVIFGYMFTLHGVVNSFLKLVKLDFLAIDWLGSPKFALWTLMIIILWKELGFGIILFLARLMSLEKEIFESAEIDGAGWWGKLFYVTIPQMRTIIEFFAIITVINMLSWVFAYSYTVTLGGPGDATMVMELFIFNKLGRSQLPMPGIASAASVFLFSGTAVLIFFLFRIRKEIGQEET